MTDLPKLNDLPKLTARGVILSLLFGNYPQQATSADLIRMAGAFGIKTSAARASLSRMDGAGDIIRNGQQVELSPRYLDRRRRLQHDIVQQTVEWNGDWRIVVVNSSARDAAERAALRVRLSRLRLGELREGVWLRPANLARPLDLTGAPVAAFRGPATLVTDESGRAEETSTGALLVAQVWDLEQWAEEARRLVGLMTHAKTPVDRFTIAAASVRHLLTDPALPPELVPDDWPSAELHQLWVSYQDEFVRIPEVLAIT